MQVTSGFNVRQVYTPLDTSFFIGVDRPYGSPNFGEGGLTGSLTLDTRDVPGRAEARRLFDDEREWYPFIKDGSGEIRDGHPPRVATYMTPSWWHAMTVATRVSGTATWGIVPYFESAFIGGGRTVRGLSQGRYEGNQAVFANLDLRLRAVAGAVRAAVGLRRPRASPTSAGCSFPARTRTSGTPASAGGSGRPCSTGRWRRA